MIKPTNEKHTAGKILMYHAQYNGKIHIPYRITLGTVRSNYFCQKRKQL